MFRVGVAAYGWWQAALCYCARYLTDGFLPVKDLDFVFPGTPHEEMLEHVEQLVAEGLLERGEDGFLMHDYLDYQPSREEAMRLRRVKAEAGRKGGKTSGKMMQQAAQARAQAPARASARPPSRPVPSRPEVVSGSSSTLLETESLGGNSLVAAPAKSAGSPPSPKARIKFDSTTGTFVGIERGDLERWALLAPGVDIPRELLRAAEWLTNNPHRRRSNIAQFITNWLTKSQDDAARRPNGNGHASRTRTDLSGLQAFAKERSHD